MVGGVAVLVGGAALLFGGVPTELGEVAVGVVGGMAMEVVGADEGT
jgi:hypothetical protein